jgi:hypothetical protein
MNNEVYGVRFKRKQHVFMLYLSKYFIIIY